MTSVRPTRVISFSSEDQNQPAENLTKPGSFRRWRCEKEGDLKAWVEFELDKLQEIKGIEVGNNGSAFVEVLVGRTGFQEADYKVLLSSSSLMSPADSKNETSMHSVRRFSSQDLNSSVKLMKWNRVRAVCTQPFNSGIKYGLSVFLLQYAEDPADKAASKASGNPTSQVTSIGGFRLKDESELTDTVKTGSLFSKFKGKLNSTDSSSSTSASAIRAASQTLASVALTESEKEATGILKESTTAGKPKTPEKASATPNKRELLNTLRERDSKRPKRDHSADSSPLPRRKDLPGETSSKKKAPEKTDVPKDGTPNPTAEANKPEENKKATKPVSPPKKKEHKPKRTRPFNQLLDDVVFVISGFQNPLRSQLRDKAVAMGAKYKGDWERSCTHLICAFFNTPKFKQVQGKGKIVTKDWIEQCFSSRKRLPWRRFCLDRRDKGPESEEEIWAEESRPASSGASNGTHPRTTMAEPPRNTSPLQDEDDDYGGSTDVDEPDTDDEIAQVRVKMDTSEVARPSSTVPPLSDLPLPELKSLFADKTFFLYGDFDVETRRQVERYIVTFKGSVAQYMGPSVDFVVTNKDAWDNHFEQAKEEHPRLVFVKPDWIWQCAKDGELVDHQQYEIQRQRR